MSFRTKAAVFKGLLAGVFALTCIAPAGAVDGVIEINQAKALAGGVTPSDTPGFPVSIDTAGSYRLTGNLRATTGFFKKGSPETPPKRTIIVVMSTQPDML